MVLSSQRVDLRDALFTAGKDKEQITNPLVQDGQKLIPSVTRVFSKSRDMYVYLQAYQPTAETAAAAGRLRDVLSRADEGVRNAAAAGDRGAQQQAEDDAAEVQHFARQAAAGRVYMCQVTVLDPKAQKAAFWQAPVMLVP